MLNQPEDRVIQWSPGYIWHLLEYQLNFKYLGMDRIQGMSAKKPKTSKHENSDGMVSIDDIIPI